MIIKLFGITKEITGAETLTIPLTEKIDTVGELRKWLASEYPAMQNLSSLAIAVEHEYADDDRQLQPKFEIALIPPVSGG